MKRGWPFLAALLLVSLYVWGRTEPASPQRLSAPSECHTTQNTANHKRPASITIICIEKESEEKEYYADTKLHQGDLKAVIPSFRHLVFRTSDDPVAAFTGLLFLTTLLLWSASERTIEHSRAASAAAVKANGLTQDAMIQSQRPWVSILLKDVGQATWTENQIVFTVDYTVANRGLTPATGVWLDVAFAVSTAMGQQDFLSLFVELIGREASMRSCGNGVTVFPNETYPWNRVFTVERSKIGSFGDGPFTINICGSVLYSGNQVDCKTSFQAVIHFIRGTFPVEGASGSAPFIFSRLPIGDRAF